MIVTVSQALALDDSAAADMVAYNGYYWAEEKTAVFELRVQGHMPKPSIEGITRWAEEPRIDDKNPDPALAGRGMTNSVFLWGFSYDAKRNLWKDGKVYDPNSGKTYSAKLSLSADGKTLKMRGYLGISLLGRTASFEKVAPGQLPPTMARE